MGKKISSNAEKKRQKKVVQKKRKDAERRKKGTTVVNENAARYQMMTQFGKPGKIDNFIRNLANLSELFGTDEDLKELRFDADKLYESFDLAQDRDYLERLYEVENALFLPEEDGDFWKEKRKSIVAEHVTEELVKKAERAFAILSQKKRGFKKDLRAVQAGQLMLDSHTTSLTGADVEENTLWEIILNTTLRENPRELPPPAEKPVEGEEADGAESAEAAEPVADAPAAVEEAAAEEAAVEEAAAEEAPAEEPVKDDE